MNKNLSQKIIYSIFVLTSIFCVPFLVNASMTNGTIDPSSHISTFAQLCLNDSCTDSTPPDYSTWINFYAATPAIHITDSELTGYFWGSKFGWVNLNNLANCDLDNNDFLDNNTRCHGDNATTVATDFKVSNTSAGILSGWAWGENAGWINFNSKVNCDQDNNTYTDVICDGDNATTLDKDFKVIIDNTGHFSGHAWSQNFGYIKFNCNLGTPYCVNTDWRPISERSSSSSGSSGGSSSTSSTSSTSSSTSSGGDTSTSSTSSAGGGDTSTSSTSTGGGGDTSTSSTSSTGGGGDTSTSSGGGGDTSTSSGGGSSSGGEGSSSGGGSGSGGGSSSGGSSSGGFVHIVNDGLGFVKDYGKEVIIKKFVPAYNTAKKFTKDVITAPAGEKVTDVVSTAGVVSGVTVSIASGIFLNPLSLPELFLIPIRLWGLLLAALGIKKRNRPWGTVYDSVTKQPLDPAYVILKDMKGNEIATSITDIDGRYGFLIGPGEYYISSSKTNYKFPSEKLQTRNYDELYNDLYFGEKITITNDGEVIAKNIPLDQLNFDWNEYAKQKQHLTRFYNRRVKWLAYLSDGVFALGLAVTMIAVFLAPRVYNIVTLAMYIILFALKKTVLRPRPQGSVIDKVTKSPIQFAIVRVYSMATKHEMLHKITNNLGKYYCLIPNGTYFVTIEKKKSDGSYEKVYTSNSIDVKDGYLKTDFEL